MKKSWIKGFIIVCLFLNYLLDLRRTNFPLLQIVNFALVCRKIEIPHGLFLHESNSSILLTAVSLFDRVNIMIF